MPSAPHLKLYGMVAGIGVAYVYMIEKLSKLAVSSAYMCALMGSKAAHLALLSFLALEKLNNSWPLIFYASSLAAGVCGDVSASALLLLD